MPNFAFHLFLCIVIALVVGLGNTKAAVWLITFGLSCDAIGFRFLGPNVLLYQVVALLLLPKSVRLLPRLFRRHPTIKLIVAYLLFMAVMAALFGYAMPWPDTTHQRPWSQQAEGRSLISMTRQLADFSLMLYFAFAARRIKILPTIATALIASIGLNLVVAAVDHAYGIRLINYVTNVNAAVLPRLGGLNGEPRILGQVCALGLLFSLYFIGRTSKFIAAFVLCAVGLAFAASTSALVDLGICLTLGLTHAVLARRYRIAVRFCVIPVLGAVAFLLLWGGRLDKNVDTRLKTLADAQDHALGEPAWMSHLEVFDRSAMRFFWANREYALLGVGPDLVNLPASEYIPTVDREIYGFRIDSPPHAGLFNIFASGGLLGVGLWIAAFAAAFINLRKVAAASNSDEAATFALLLPIIGVFGAITLTPFLWGALGLAVGIAERTAAGYARRVSAANNVGTGQPLRIALG